MNRPVIGIFILAQLFLFYSPALAQTLVKAEVDRTAIAADETLTYKLTISSSVKIIPQPKLPEFTGFSVVSSAQSSQFSLSQGALKSTVNYTLILLPQQTGKLKINPARIRVEGKDYSSQGFEIEVKPGKTRIQTPQQKIAPPENQTDAEPQLTL